MFKFQVVNFPPGDIWRKPLIVPKSFASPISNIHQRLTLLLLHLSPPSCRVSDEQCLLIMSVRKGKRLISRLIPFLPPLQAATVVMGIARNLPALAKKDKQDQV